jgi:hypothetical protein
MTTAEQNLHTGATSTGLKQWNKVDSIKGSNDQGDQGRRSPHGDLNLHLRDVETRGCEKETTGQ